MSQSGPSHPSERTLQAHLRGELDPHLADFVRLHLESCPDCRRLAHQQTVPLIGVTARPSASPGSDSQPSPSLPGTVPGWEAQVPSSAVDAVPPELRDHPQYQVIRELGRGGMGVVYLARNLLMDRPEVLKVLNRSMLETPGMTERFLREIRSAARLSHPNIVTAFAALQIQGLFLFAMEYVEGEDLARLVRDLGPLPVSHACDCAYQAAVGLQHAFEKGMIHRDIKPHNLIVTRVPTQQGGKVVVKILDFGLAKASHADSDDGSLTDAGQMLGTPHYMAPEQGRDAQTADIRADIYSLGCTLFFLLTGRTPYPQGSTFQIIHAHCTGAIPSVLEFRSDVPEEVDAAIQRMMAKQPADRFQTPAEVARALAPFRTARYSSKPTLIDDGRTSGIGPSIQNSSSRPTRARAATSPITTFASSDWLRGSDPGSTPLPPPPPRRWPIVVASLLTASALAAVGLVAYSGRWWGDRRPPTPPETISQSREPVPDTGRLIPDHDQPPAATPPAPTPPSSPTRPARATMAAWVGAQAGEVREAQLSGRDFRFRWCPPGRFVFGSPRDEPGRQDDEGPTELDLADGFWIQEAEFSQAQWIALDGPALRWNVGAEPDLPVYAVDYREAADMAVMLTRRLRETEQLPDGLRAILPTEAEWEYAARAGSRTRFGFGDDEAKLGDYAWFGENSGQRPRPVATRQPNAWGLFDMAGNMMEWCRADESEERSADLHGVRPHRGGSWFALAEYCRSAARKSSPVDTRASYIGFRLVIVPDRKPAEPIAVVPARPAEPTPAPTPVPVPVPVPEPESRISRTNSLGMRMIRIEPGSFAMGTAADGLERLRTLFPKAPRDAFLQEDQHPVSTTKPFLMADREVTVGQFRRFVAETSYVTDAETSGGSHTYDGKGFRLDPDRTWRSPGFAQTDDHPVVCVSQNDARKFAQWLSSKEGRHYQLPTDVEWEYAARAGSEGLFGQSDDPASLAKVGNVADASYRKLSPKADCLSEDDGHAYTSPVGSYPANAWGLHDMLGNVAEWCIAASNRNQPYRGGSWIQAPRQCRPASRSWEPASRRLNYLGFRLMDTDVSTDP